MGKLGRALQALVWLAPASTLKNRILSRLGHSIHESARVSPNLVWGVRRFVVEPGGKVGRGNMFRNLTLVEVGPGASIGFYNVMSAHPAFGRLYPDGAQLVLGRSAMITSHHTLDCSGGVHLAEFAGLAGKQSLVLTHGLDMDRNAQAAYPVTFGERSFSGARCVILGGAQLPARSFLAAGSVLPKGERTDSGLWAGVPARFLGERSGAWYDRSEQATRDVYVPHTGEIITGALGRGTAARPAPDQAPASD